jgi:hypothetical protein
MDADGARATSLDVVVEHGGAQNIAKPIRPRTWSASMVTLTLFGKRPVAPSDNERQSAAVDLERILRGETPTACGPACGPACGEHDVRGQARVKSRFRSRTGPRAHDVVAGCQS